MVGYPPPDIRPGYLPPTPHQTWGPTTSGASLISQTRVRQPQRSCTNILFPPANEVVGRQCLHRYLSVHGVPCHHYPCIGPYSPLEREPEGSPWPQSPSEMCRQVRTLKLPTHTELFPKINQSSGPVSPNEKVNVTVKARLHQASMSLLRQLCKDASDTVLIENNGVTPEWGCNPFLSDSIVFNEISIPSVMAELPQS